MTDYLKTTTLIENILGNPQKDRALACDWGFTGLEFDEQIFPTEIQASTIGAEETTGTYINAKYKNKDKVKLLYEIKKYLVMFTFTWDEGEQTYKLTSNKEIYFGITFNLNSESEQAIVTPLLSWREDYIKKEEEQGEQDIINTTLFSCDLQCREYEYDKRLKNSEQFCFDNRVHHIATYHKEDSPVTPYSEPNTSSAIAYPVFIPSKPSKKIAPPHRRGDCCDDN